MIVVKVELHSARTGDVSNLGTVVIDNIGGTYKRRNYRVRSFRKGVDVIKTMRRKGLLRESLVEGHASLSLPVYALVRKALEAMKY